MRRMLFISAQRMDDEEMKSQQPRVACFSRREMICFRRGDDKYGRKKYYFQAPQRKGLSQEDLAEKVFVTRQAVSRWENGETVPGTETLKLLSKVFDVSINTLLGSPRQLICQCCGMPLDDASLSKEIDGAFNEDYCKWCYSDGRFTYESMEELIDYLAEHMSDENRPPAQVRTYFEEWLPTLRYWKRSEK